MKKTALLVLIIVFSLLAGTAPVQAQEDACFDRGGLWNEETGKCEYQTGLNIEITYPLELVDHEFADTTLTEFLNAARRDFLTNFSDYGAEFSSFGDWEIIITYSIYQYSEDIVSVKFDIYEYSGGAHGNHYFETFTFDLVNQQVLNFEDLFQEEFDPLLTIAPIVQTDLEAKLSEMGDSQWIQDGTGSNINNYRNFVVTNDTLVLLFPPYQVAPYVAGSQVVEIPLADLQAILAPPFLQLD